MIGRAPELAALAQATGAVLAGRAGCVLVSGEAGVGKTRLVGEALTRAGLPAFSGASPATVAPPYEAVAQILRAAMRVRPGLPAACGPFQPYLAALLPELGPAAPDISVGTLVEALRRAFAAGAAPGPAGVVLADLPRASGGPPPLPPH